MFTGIVEEIGIIKSFVQNKTCAIIEVEANIVLEATKIGDSISIDGCCQSVVSFGGNSFVANVSSETLKMTTFKNFQNGKKVNLERALTPTSRMGGHIVQGHVDGVGILKNIQKMSEFYDLTFEIPSDLEKYIVNKGSIAVDGISLTVASVENNLIRLAIIPHTYENTTLKNLKIADCVNLETDILGRYIEKFLCLKQDDKTSKIDEKFLVENGFM